MLAQKGVLSWELPCVFTVNDARWDIHFQALLEFRELIGHCDVGSRVNYQTSDGSVLKLGRWLKKQRQNHLDGTMKPRRAFKLQVLIDCGYLHWMPRVSDHLNLQQYQDSQNMWIIHFTIYFLYVTLYGAQFGEMPDNFRIKCGKILYSLGSWLKKTKEWFNSKRLPASLQVHLEPLVAKGVFSWKLDMDHVNAKPTESGSLYNLNPNLRLYFKLIVDCECMLIV